MAGTIEVDGCWKGLTIVKDDVAPRGRYDEENTYRVPVVCRVFGGLISWEVSTNNGMPEVRCMCSTCKNPEE